MKVVITGSAGFVGSHLAELFLGNGHSVICVDNLITGSMENISHITDRNFRFINHDITKPIPIDEPVDGVLNFASPASPVDFDRIPLEIMDVNSIGTRNCLELARRNNARFLMASTSEVYGDPLVHPQDEDYYGNVNPRGIRAVYDESKRFAEALIYAYRRMYDMDVRVVRIFNTYGPRMRADDGRVVPNFVTQALSGRPLTIYGEGQQTRSFCYVSDEVEGIYRLFNSDYSEPVNIGNPCEFKIMELIGVMEKILGKELNVVKLPMPEGDPRMRCPDISRARRILKWEPRIDLLEGMQRTMEWFADKMQVRL